MFNKYDRLIIASGEKRPFREAASFLTVARLNIPCVYDYAVLCRVPRDIFIKPDTVAHFNFVGVDITNMIDPDDIALAERRWTLGNGKGGIVGSGFYERDLRGLVFVGVV